MSKPILMPQVGQDLTEGKLIEWRVKVGDTVSKGDIVAVVESEKASFEVEAFEAGTVLGLLYDEGATTKVLAPLLFVGDPGEAKAADQPAAVAAAIPEAVAKPEAAPAAVFVSEKANRSSPLARRLAGENGLELTSIAGSGPRGAVVKRDIDQALQARAPTTPAPTGLEPRPAAAPPEAPKRVAPAGAGSLHRVWLRKGQGDPVVMIHGFGADLNAWRVLVAAAALSRPVLAIDLPGHGGSPASQPASFDAMVSAVAATLAEEGVTGADLVGHSLGAAVAVAVANGARFTLRSLFLIAPAGLGPDINGAFLTGFARARSAASLAPWMALLVADGKALGAAFIQVTADTRAAPGIAEAQDQIAGALFPDGTQVVSIRQALHDMAVPVRIVFGAEDRIIPARHALGLPGTIGLHIFPGVGHLPQIEARDAVARLLVEHLRSAG